MNTDNYQMTLHFLQFCAHLQHVIQSSSHKHLLESMSSFSAPQKKPKKQQQQQQVSEPCHFMLEFSTLCGPLRMVLFDSFLGGYERLMLQKHLQQFLNDSCKSAVEQLREDSPTAMAP